MFLQFIVQFLVVLVSLPLSRGLHFYLKSGQVKCFYENLSLGNLMIGDIDGYVEREDTFVEDPDLRLTVSVDESFDSNHRVMNQKNAHTGDFTFTALDTGEHRICIMPSYPQEDARLRIFMELDITNMRLLDTRRKDDERTAKQRVLQMVRRLEVIRLEQKDIRKKEALFRNQSESANSKILRWSCLQVLGLVIMCVLQLRYLKNFFVKQKVI
ncbi:hypothetical protein ZYGR_0U00440 [Zygosaccharomyces rouxii]|uniref:ZYRO0F09702p n=2 Tax=Zygosaccharomyces rouxii TaxID=4956 RepID=C5DY25_ZYGRC|nr:uncharacterized protein ZYRO0F09702g [Zygosaccharomyces rouxii]KAH9199444.1 emp24/gp25L/p24 family/GOLD-domain-containing protein [Zygosaccharomyces rouxii]GAV50188.1 hypothetical protein ZYGR_0U00440 [Zygosaccharomyces rouxii]CAR28686.1 ZYRO0F09702p [Zygosaccharomyces rouxii]